MERVNEVHFSKVSLFEKFITEGKEKAGEPAKEGAMMDGGGMARIRASTFQQQREEVCAAPHYAASFHCLVEERQDCEELKPKPKEKWTFIMDRKQEAKKHRMECCALASKNRCMRCGRSNKQIKLPGTCEGPRWQGKDPQQKFKRWSKQHIWDGMTR